MNELHHAIFISKRDTKDKVPITYVLIRPYMNILGEPSYKLFFGKKLTKHPDVSIWEFE